MVSDLETNMKYRNGLTNIGIICGFATSPADGELVVHQCSAKELGFRFRLADGVRGAELPYEPVTVVFRLIPTEDGQPPTLEALHVSRMAKAYVPKTFSWNASNWPRDLDFYPFEPARAGRLTADVVALIAAAPDFPQWLIDAAEQDDALAPLLEGTTSNKHLVNRFLLTGKLTPGEIVETQRVHEAHDYLRIWVRQGDTDEAIGARMPAGTAGFRYMSDRRCGPDGVPSTIFGKVLMTSDSDGETLSNVALDLLLLEANAVAPCDLQP